MQNVLVYVHVMGKSVMRNGLRVGMTSKICKNRCHISILGVSESCIENKSESSIRMWNRLRMTATMTLIKISSQRRAMFFPSLDLDLMPKISINRFQVVKKSVSF